MSADDPALASRLDDVAGAQLALAAAVKLLLSAYKGNPAAAIALESELERQRAMALASSFSERKLRAFEAIAETLISAVTASTSSAHPPPS